MDPPGSLRYHAIASPGYMERWFPRSVTAQAVKRDHFASGVSVEPGPGTALDMAFLRQFTRLAAPPLAPLTEAIRAAARQTLVH